MKLSLTVFLAAAQAASASLLERDGCNRDNCLRAVNGAQYGKIECEQYLKKILIPYASTISIYSSTATVLKTTTTTVTAYTVRAGNRKRAPAPTAAPDPLITPAVLEKRTEYSTLTSSVLPSYASAPCGGFPRYSSACSCLGVPASTVTAPPGYITTYLVSTTTSTVTATATTTVAACNAAENYGFKYSVGYFESRESDFGSHVQSQGPYVLGLKACCAKCFETKGCVSSFHTTEGNCFLNIEASATSSPPTNICPLGIAKAFFNGPDGSGSLTALGPCAVIAGPNV